MMAPQCSLDLGVLITDATTAATVTATGRVDAQPPLTARAHQRARLCQRDGTTSLVLRCSWVMCTSAHGMY